MAVPLATTEKLTLDPEVTLCETGCVVMLGAVAAELLSELPPPHAEMEASHSEPNYQQKALNHGNILLWLDGSSEHGNAARSRTTEALRIGTAKCRARTKMPAGHLRLAVRPF